MWSMSFSTNHQRVVFRHSSALRRLSLTRFFSEGNRSDHAQGDNRKIQEDHAYCVNLVRERDREGYCKFFRSS